MKDLNLTDLFCEILSGFLALLVSVLLLDCFGLIEMPKMEKWPSGESIFAIVLFSYFAGLIVDAIGLAAGELFLDKWASKEPSPTADQMKNYYTKASESVMNYRKHQWTFYSLYRNILILAAIGLIPSFLKMQKLFGSTFSIISCLIIILIGICIFRSMKALLELYYDIPKTFTPT